jgi:hypothetical protein
VKRIPAVTVIGVLLCTLAAASGCVSDASDAIGNSKDIATAEVDPASIDAISWYLESHKYHRRQHGHAWCTLGI